MYAHRIDSLEKMCSQNTSVIIKLILAQQIHCNCLDTNLRRGGKVDGVFHQFVVTVVQICGGNGGKDGDAHWCQLEITPHNWKQNHTIIRQH